MKGIITLCGSTRFKDDFLDAAKWLTLGGWIVLMPNVFGHKETYEYIKLIINKQKRMLDALHLQKISISKCILVIDVDEYIGSSTKLEIEFAKTMDLDVHYISCPDIIENLNNG